MILFTGKQSYASDHGYTHDPKFSAWTLELTYSGRMLRRVDDGPFLEQPNMALLLVPPKARYALRGREPGVEIWLTFRPTRRLRELLAWPVGKTGIPELNIAGSRIGTQIIQAFEDAHQHTSMRTPRQDQLAELSLERLLLLAAELDHGSTPQADPRIQKTLDLIHADFMKPLDITLLAKASALSSSRFAHLFRACVNASPMHYLEGVRVNEAQQLLLRTDLSIKEIAARVGYDDPLYFSTRFRKRVGKHPSGWRTQPTPLV